MSTQQIRNIINTQVDSLITQAKNDIRNEQTKQLDKLKKKIPTPKDISSSFNVDINSKTCSDRGNEKFYNKYDKKYEQLNKLNNIVKDSLTKIDDLEFKLNQIKNGEGPFVFNQQIVSLINEVLLPILTVIVALAPALLAVLSGPAASHALGDKIQEKRKKAKSKIEEYRTAMASIKHLLEFYYKKALKILAALILLRAALKFIQNEIDKTLLFMHSHTLRYEEECNALNQLPVGDNNTNSNTEGGTGVIPNPDIPTELTNYLALLEQQYNDVLGQIQQSGNEKAWRRIFTLKENLEEDYNIRFSLINL